MSLQKENCRLSELTNERLTASQIKIRLLCHFIYIKLDFVCCHLTSGIRDVLGHNDSKQVNSHGGIDANFSQRQTR